MNDLKLVMKLEKIFFDYMYINVNTQKVDENENFIKMNVKKVSSMHTNNLILCIKMNVKRYMYILCISPLLQLLNNRITWVPIKV